MENYLFARCISVTAVVRRKWFGFGDELVKGIDFDRTGEVIATVRPLMWLERMSAWDCNYDG